MIRIRFHGRGGHGVKTASRVVGTAAFLAGFHCQDSPVYGAERRGAPVTAFTRISDRPIRERGTITQPDLIIVADDTLLGDPTAGVLIGQESAAALFLNSADPTARIEKHGIATPVVSFDVTTKTRSTFGRASVLSAGIAGAAARLCGCVSLQVVQEALREEFSHLSVSPEVVEKNVAIISEVFAGIAPIEIKPAVRTAVETMVEVAYVDPLLGTSTVYSGGNARQLQTGAWRTERPVVDAKTCSRCGLCFVDCPDGAIALDAGGFPIIDYEHCKGCLICSQVCPVHAITYQAETATW